jgi:cytochrome P450
MVDQVAIFFLAGHETSASALSWALYLLGYAPTGAGRVAAEAAAMGSRLRHRRQPALHARRVPRGAAALPARADDGARNRKTRRDARSAVPKGSQIVLSPWHLHRHERLWENPDGLTPTAGRPRRGAPRPATPTCRFRPAPRLSRCRVCHAGRHAPAGAVVVRSFRFGVVEGPRAGPRRASDGAGRTASGSGPVAGKCR